VGYKGLHVGAAGWAIQRVPPSHRHYLVTPAKAGVQIRPARARLRLDSGLRRNDGRVQAANRSDGGPPIVPAEG